MKTGTSTLNPYAESYVPISRRGAPDGNKEARFSPKEFKSGSEAVWLAPGVTAGGSQQQTHQTADQYKLKDYSAYGSPSHSPAGAMVKQVLDEESDMDLAYLQMTFPGMSDESLSEVYLANKCDLDAAVDMLNQLELYSGDFSEKLPDTLDIGDVSDSGFLGDSSSQKLKTVVGETVTVASSSGLSDSAPGS
ncbi:PREDICTED: polyadenylate-binding protein-interacting protein 6 isoform X1 [Nicotiana attenuata]|uniref:Polyadenylate-binding protein-interacting protein 6 n=1 Tax=Nicotiana attenuata TaxID=49451 RepID=A0A314LFY1_NICAT|nr:PREDICTED: polyadenylate-binding protein-interacting protein 6 isoform X1 [Nicotiana attenuata]OIT39939.1 polyadenylate-binding protein-interacting protein 6 [Nicotiana attenuata]